MPPEDIFAEMTAYNIAFVERPHPAFNDLPVCPFAKKARLEHKLQYEICDLDIHHMLDQIERWRTSGTQTIILVIPDNEMPFADFLLHFELLKATLPKDLSVFEAHPHSDYLYHGVYTRREPYPNFQVMRISDLDRAHDQLLHSHWYETGKGDDDGVRCVSNDGDHDQVRNRGGEYHA